MKLNLKTILFAAAGIGVLWYLTKGKDGSDTSANKSDENVNDVKVTTDGNKTIVQSVGVPTEFIDNGTEMVKNTTTDTLPKTAVVVSDTASPGGNMVSNMNTSTGANASDFSVSGIVKL